MGQYKLEKSVTKASAVTRYEYVSLCTHPSHSDAALVHFPRKGVIWSAWAGAVHISELFSKSYFEKRFVPDCR